MTRRENESYLYIRLKQIGKKGSFVAQQRWEDIKSHDLVQKPRTTATYMTIHYSICNEIRA